MSLIRAFAAIAGRELRLGLSGAGGGFLPAAFFAGATMVAPFAVGPDPELLGRIGPGFLWLALSLAALVSLERLFQADLEDGTLDQLLLSPAPLTLVALAKVLGQWAASAAPLLAVTPIAGLLVQVPPAALPLLVVQLTVGSLAMYLVGAIAAALGAGVRRGGLLVALLALPLYAPTVIFGAGAADLAVKGEGLFTQPFLFVCALALMALALAPLAIAAALRLHAD